MKLDPKTKREIESKESELRDARKLAGKIGIGHYRRNNCIGLIFVFLFSMIILGPIIYEVFMSLFGK